MIDPTIQINSFCSGTLVTDFYITDPYFDEPQEIGLVADFEFLFPDDDDATEVFIREEDVRANIAGDFRAMIHLIFPTYLPMWREFIIDYIEDNRAQIEHELAQEISVNRIGQHEGI